MWDESYLRKYIDLLIDGFKFKIQNIPQIISFIVLPISMVLIGRNKWMIVLIFIFIYYFIFLSFGFLVYRFVNFLRDNVLKDILPIRKRIEELKGESFSKRNTVEGDSVINLDEVIRISKIPSKTTLNFWIYELSNKKTHLEVILPKAMYLVSISFFVIILILGKVVLQFDVNWINNYNNFINIIQSNVIVPLGVLGGIVLTTLSLISYDSEIKRVDEDINFVNLITTILDDIKN